LENSAVHTPQNFISPDPTLLQMRASAEAKNVALVRTSLRRVLLSLDITQSDLDDIMLAVGEACNNAVLHGYHVPSQTISVNCSYNKSPVPTVTVEISNLGTKLVDIFNDSLFAMPPAELMSEHGRGLPLIRSLVDKVDVYRDGQCTVVRMIKRV
jgi:serine/threonine-protein kinase RsbW